MAIGDIVFVKGQGGLGRPLAGQDFISGLLLYYPSGKLPSGFSASGAPGLYNVLFQPSDANALGILPAFDKNNPLSDANFADATAASGTYTPTGVGSVGDITIINAVVLTNVIVNNIATVATKTVTLCTYVTAAGDTSDTFLGASIAAAINANSYNTGFTATAASGVVTIIFPKFMGLAANGSNTLVGASPIVVTLNGASQSSEVAQPSGGTQSYQALWYYQISEFFRIQPQGQLYIGFAPTYSSGHTFGELTLLQQYSGGTIRQFGILQDGALAYSSAFLTAIDLEIKTNDDAVHMNTSALYAADISATTNLATLTNLNTLSANKVSAVISQDGAAFGALLFSTYTKSVISLGATLGAVSLAAVNESIEWRAKFNMSNGTELDVPAFGNGQLVKAQAQSYLDAIDNNRYVFLIKNIGFAGTYFNASHTAIINTSDYAFIENNRTIDKAIRGVYSSLLPALGSPITLNSDGTLTNESIAYFESLAEVNLNAMVSATELSDFEVTIDPTQNVLSTNNLVVAIELFPVGVARSITVNIGFVVKLT